MAGPESGIVRRIVIQSLIGITVTAAILTLLGPYQTGLQPLPQRALLWFTSIGTNWFIFVAVQQIALRLFPPARWPWPVPYGLAAAIGAVPTTAFVIWFEPRAAGIGMLPGYLGAYLSVLFLSVLITLAMVVLVRYRQRTDQPQPGPLDREAQMAGAGSFLGTQLPRLAHARLVAIEAEDHYLRVHTDAGSDLVLMRLRDAVAQLGDIRGLQVHRSYWVAEDGIASIGRENGRLTIILQNGVKVPVSRGYAPQVGAAGWLQRFNAPAKSLA